MSKKMIVCQGCGSTIPAPTDGGYDGVDDFIEIENVEPTLEQMIEELVDGWGIVLPDDEGNDWAIGYAAAISRCADEFRAVMGVTSQSI